MSRITDEVFLLPTNSLEQALAAELAGHERDWTAGVDEALGRLERRLQQHMAVAANPDGLYAEVDVTRSGLGRQIDDLRREHIELLTRIGNLRDELGRAVRGGAPDFGLLRQHVQELVLALHRHTSQETDLLQESVTTDIGAGD